VEQAGHLARAHYTLGYATSLGVAVLLIGLGALARPAVGATPAGAIPAWVSEKPKPRTQTQRTAEERGINPCATPDPGFGVYGGWHRDVAMGQYLRPPRGGLRSDDSFDVMFHFHGHEPARKEWVKEMSGAVFASVDLGVGSGAYEETFADPSRFEEYVRSVEKAIRLASGRPQAHARHIGLSAWSAGYGAVLKILAQPTGKRIDTVVLLDGLHAGYVDGHVDGRQIESVRAFARAAARNPRKLFFMSHSSIIPPGYASTTETAHFLVWSVGGKPRARHTKTFAPMGLEMISAYDLAGFHERGYDGNDKMDHCAHIGLYKDVLRHYVKPLWRTPKGRVK
jgi:hypothetical protein